VVIWRDDVGVRVSRSRSPGGFVTAGTPTVDASRAMDAGRHEISGLESVTLVVLLAAVVGLYAGVLTGLWNDWWHNEDYAHGILVVPAIGWLVWRKRASLAAIRRRPSAAGAVIVAVSLGVFLVGQAALEFYLTRLSLVGVAAGTVVQLLGWRHLRILRFPLLLFTLAIPLPALVFNEVAFPLQLLASRIGVAMLSLGGIPVVREGNVIVLQNATLEVAEACSGVRSLISVLTLALVYWSVTAQRMWIRVAILTVAVPVVLLANGLRVAGAGLAAQLYGATAATGFLHTFSGWVFFGASVALLLAVERGVVLLGRRAAHTRDDRGKTP
jgi:exosortase